MMLAPLYDMILMVLKLCFDCSLLCQGSAQLAAQHKTPSSDLFVDGQTHAVRATQRAVVAHKANNGADTVVWRRGSL
jgi:hypothetical protein